LPILQVQEMNDLGYAGLYLHFSEIQLVGDIVVVQTLTERAVNRAKDARLFPKAAHFMPPT
jgi:hypothetical protein